MSALDIAKRHNLLVDFRGHAAPRHVEYLQGAARLGTLGQLGAISFHETKNGDCRRRRRAVRVEWDPQFIERAAIVARNKGLNRSRFFPRARRQVTPGSISAAPPFCRGSIVRRPSWFAQLEQATSITAKRLELWNA
jgi:dTDP-4-amino-4,6-dideoxygalactose transaminase